MALSEAARRTGAARTPMGRVLGTLVLLVAGLAAAFLAGFCRFAQTVTSVEPPENARADAIVALTGGASRIQDALQLLSEGRGRRLLITGVNPTTSRRELMRQTSVADELFDCCVDLDWRAMNTIGNAEEARKWAERGGFRSLIVVTSGYNMPPSMVELNRVMPEIDLIPYPVVPERLRDHPWWRDPQTARLLLGEFVKFVVAIARIRVEPSPPDARLAQAAGTRPSAEP